MFEQLKLWYRAYRYKTKDDVGGISYILNNVKHGNTVLDIGAHKAGYLYFIRKMVGSEGRVVAFEPQQILFRYLQIVVAEFKWKNVEIVHLALSDRKGQAQLMIPKQRQKSSSSPGATIAHLSNKDSFEIAEFVETETLDAFCANNNLAPDFLKIDVEGNELALLKGSIQVLKQYKPKILVEIEARHVGKSKAIETFSFLEELGYSGFFIQGTHLIPITDFSFDHHQTLSDKRNYCNNFVFE